MDYHSMEAAIRADIKTLRTLHVHPVPASRFYLSILSCIVAFSLTFLGVNSLIQLGLHALGLYYPAITPTLLLIAWGMTLVMGFFMSFSGARLLLMNSMLKGQLQTITLIKRKIFQWIAVFFGAYSLIYCMATFLIVAGLDQSDLIKAHEELWFSIFFLAFPQFLAGIVAFVMTGFIALIELERLSLGPLFQVIGEISKKRRFFDRSNYSTWERPE